MALEDVALLVKHQTQEGSRRGMVKQLSLDFESSGYMLIFLLL